MQAAPSHASADSVVQRFADSTATRALSVALAREGRVVYAIAIGYRNLEDSVRADTATLFRIASVTKLIMASLVMRLAEVGRLDLDIFAPDSLAFEPGTRFAYTNVGFLLLGCAVQGATGQKYADALIELMLGPAGMRRAQPNDAWRIIPNRARIYQGRTMANAWWWWARAQKEELEVDSLYNARYEVRASSGMAPAPFPSSPRQRMTDAVQLQLAADDG
jgi:CubicO group peptidase (beta-lactamase class C family)